MKRINLLKNVLLFLIVLSFSSCALKPVTSEFSFIKNESGNVNLEELGNGKILIFNGADALHKIDNTARLNVWIDDKPLGQLKPSEYLIIDLKNQKYLFKVLHIDMFKMKSEHEVEIDNNTKIIKIKPTITSNKLEVTNILPNNFDKFSYVKN